MAKLYVRWKQLLLNLPKFVGFAAAVITAHELLGTAACWAVAAAAEMHSVRQLHFTRGWTHHCGGSCDCSLR
jgi:hypothetical protein